ncbi:MAG: Fic family protein [Ferruginibacter sp.]
MDTENIISLINKFQSLNLSSVIDFDKFNLYAITHHSTTIEGSTLTEVETRLLLDEGITPAGKPLLHSLMVKDHYAALLFVLQSAKEKKEISSGFIQQINSEVMKNTGSIYHTLFGELNAAEGVFRKGNVSAGNTYFVNFDKVPSFVGDLCKKLNEAITPTLSLLDKITICFDAHFDLVTIHPFYDGNGRTSRLLMNFLQQIFELPLSIIFKEDKASYFEALIKTREQENLNIFRHFMLVQYAKYLNLEIEKYNSWKNDGKKGYSFIF